MTYQKYENVDISELAQFRAWAKSVGQKYKIRYRGPRRKGPYGRVTSQGQSTCLKRDALRFTAYPL
jgi:hypothetical protein